MTFNCPYCNILIERERKKKCPNCKKELFFKKNPNTKAYSYLRLEDLPLHTEEINKYNSEKKYNYYRNWFVDEMNISKEYLEEQLKNWLASHNNISSKNDFLWSMFNRLISDLPNKTSTLDGLIHKQRLIYLKMWEFLNDEKKDATHIRKSIYLCDLLQAENSSYLTEIVVNATHCCENCKQIDGKALTVKQAIEKQLLPNPKCTRHSCTCFYSTRALRNEKGRLIMK